VLILHGDSDKSETLYKWGHTKPEDMKQLIQSRAMTYQIQLGSAYYCK